MKSRIDIVAIIAIVSVCGCMVACHRRETRVGTERTECIYNLRNLGGGYASFIADNDRTITEVSTNQGGTKEYAEVPEMAYMHFRTIVSLYRRTSSPEIPVDDLVCPLDKRLPAPLNSVFNTNISYFLSLNSPRRNGGWIVAGSRNLSVSPVTNQSKEVHWRADQGLHRDAGYLLQLDCSVTRVDDQKLNTAFNKAGNFTNRIVIP